jgi:hypothetical protein
MTDHPVLDIVRTEALDRIDRVERRYRLAFFGAVAIEVTFLAAYVLLADFSNRLHVLLLLATVAIYSLLALGLVALGAHVTRSTLRIIRAVELVDRRN